MRTAYLEPVGPRVALRPLDWADEAEFIALTRASVGLHHPWMSLPGTPEEFGEFMARFDQPGNIGLVVCDRTDGAIVGGININNIVHGRFQSAALGYWVFAPAAGRGYMSEAIRLVIGYAFGPLQAAPAGGQHPAGQSRLDPAGETQRLPLRGLLARLPVHRRRLAGARAVGHHPRDGRACR